MLSSTKRYMSSTWGLIGGMQVSYGNEESIQFEAEGVEEFEREGERGRGVLEHGECRTCGLSSVHIDPD